MGRNAWLVLMAFSSLGGRVMAESITVGDPYCELEAPSVWKITFRATYSCEGVANLQRLRVYGRTRSNNATLCSVGPGDSGEADCVVRVNSAGDHKVIGNVNCYTNFAAGIFQSAQSMQQTNCPDDPNQQRPGALGPTGVPETVEATKTKTPKTPPTIGTPVGQ